jgi:hypothetical protein
MAAIENVTYSDWESFRRDYRGTLFGNGNASKGEFLFRGQSDADWPLESSFDRWFTASGRPHDERARFAKELLENFKQELMDSPEHRDSESLDADELMALGQHYGLPTRLLDWSRSLYIAAYFAFSDALFNDRQSRYVAIWALNAKSPIWRADYGARIVTLQAKSNARLRNQESCFTLLNSLEPVLEDFLRRASPNPREVVLWKLMVPSAFAKDALLDLDFIGFGARRLFPDYWGYARSAFATVATK